MSKIESKVVIVTGSGRAIARQVALDFAAEGARVVVVDMIEERAKRTVSEIEAAGGTALAAVCDVRDETAVQQMVEQTVRTFGRVDVLVNAAGGYTMGRVTHELSAADWDMVLDSNLKGSFLCCKHVIPHMLAAGGGRIINFSSNAGRTSSPALGVHYTAAKAGVLGLTRHLAKEYAAAQHPGEHHRPRPGAGGAQLRDHDGGGARAAAPGDPARPLRRAVRPLGGRPLPRRGRRAAHHRRHPRRQRRLRDGVAGARQRGRAAGGER